MSQVYLFQLASQQAKWLSDRQTVVASNISNADTPGYKAVDVAPFTSMLESLQVAMTTSDPMHMTAPDDSSAPVRLVETNDADETLSGNTVNLEQELIKEGDINRSYSLDTNVTRIFHQMLLAALK